MPSGFSPKYITELLSQTGSNPLSLDKRRFFEHELDFFVFKQIETTQL